MVKNTIRLILTAVLNFSITAICFALNMDTLEAKFLQGNYRDVISRGEILLESVDARDFCELSNYIALSYLKTGDTQSAKKYFENVLLKADSTVLKERARIGLADAFLLSGDLKNSQQIYLGIIEDNPNTKLKAAILYRISRIALNDGNNQKANEYLFKLKKDYPLAEELNLKDELRLSTLTLNKDNPAYTVQVGYFSNSVNADKLKKELIAKGYPAYIDDSSGSYRVRVGRLNNQEAANSLEDKLLKDGYSTKIFP